MYKTNILKVSRQVKWKVQVLAQNADTYCNNICGDFENCLQISVDSLRVVEIHLEF